MLTATLTRPTTINPTTSCDQKIYLIEDIDIAPLLEPKPRFISLKPVSNKVKTRKDEKQPSPDGSKVADSATEESARSSRLSEASGNVDNVEIGSVAPSEDSNETSGSSKAASGGNSGGGGGGSAKNNSNSAKNSDEKSVKQKQKKPITATIQLLKAGYLRGDNIPIRISVRHSKPVKSLHGIIVTLYRQARVDMYPALPLANRDGKKEKEEYYPKSKTGLGGLSLTSAGSSHMFRKDLSQSYAPLIVDPKTLTTEVKVAVRVPDEAFPTIASVPGGMISFRYYVEVLVDLQGKLAGLGRFNSGMMSVPSSYGSVPGMGLAEDASGSVVSSWGGNFIDTESIRRENKSIVACIFEVIVGTKDTARRRGKQKVQVVSAEIQQREIGGHVGANGAGDLQLADRDGRENHAGRNGYDGYEAYDSYDGYDYEGYEGYNGYHGYQHDHGYNIAHHDHYYGQYPGGGDYHNMPHSAHSHSLTPMPTLEDESQLPEKEQMRRAEERLLPSRPPEIGESSAAAAAAAAAHTPSAPLLPSDPQHAPSPLYTPTSNGQPLPSPTTPTALSPSGPATAMARLSVDDGLSAPSYEDVPPSPASAAATDDKQELHRRRLEMERSAPEQIPEEEEEGEEGSGPGTGPSAPPETSSPYPSAPPMSPSDFAPSAPPEEAVEAEEERRALGLGAGAVESASRGGGEILPQYEPR